MNAPPTILRAKLDRFLHEGFVFIRNRISDLSDPDPAVRREVHEVADALEVIPTLFHRWDEEGWETNSGTFVREIVDDLAVRVPHLGERFQMLLDMPDDEYEAFYLKPHPWPGDEAVAEPPPAARAA